MEEQTPDFDTILKRYQDYYEQHCNIKAGPYEGIFRSSLKGSKNSAAKWPLSQTSPWEQ